MTQLVVQTNPSLINPDNSSDDVQEIGYTPVKNNKPTYYNQIANELSGVGVDEADATNQAQKVSSNQRINESQKKLSNPQMRTPDNVNRGQDSLKISNYQHSDDKSLELKKTADNQLTSILNISDLKSNEIGAANRLMFLFFPNQPQIALSNPYNFNSLLAPSNPGIFTQDFGSFSQIIHQDGNNLLYNGNNGPYFSNGAACLNQIDARALMHASRINMANIATMEEQRRQQFSQNTQNMTVNQPANNNNPQKAQPGHSNSEKISTNYHGATKNENNHPVTEENVDTQNAYNSKIIKGDGAEGLNGRKKRVKQCFNIYCQTDPENASLWSKTRVTGKMSCKVCEEAWKNQQYCYFCKQIYLEEGDAFNDPKPWIGCDTCNRWTHTECEEKTLQKRIKWYQDRNEDFEYRCPNCRPKVRTPGRGKPKRSIPQSNELPRNVIEHPIYDEIQEDSIRKQVKMNPDSPEANYMEINTNSNTNLTAFDEPCLAKRKLENMFNRHLQKKKLQYIKPIVHVDPYMIIDNLLTQHGKKLQLTENEVQHDLMLMRNTCQKNPSDNHNPLLEEETINYQNYESTKNRNSSRNLEEEEVEKKIGARSKARGRGGHNKRTNRVRKNIYDMQEEDVARSEDFDSEYVPGNHAGTRQARGKRNSE